MTDWTCRRTLVPRGCLLWYCEGITYHQSKAAMVLGGLSQVSRSLNNNVASQHEVRQNQVKANERGNPVSRQQSKQTMVWWFAIV